GIEVGSFGGTFDAFLAAVHSDDREAVVEVVQQAIEHRSRFDISYRTVGADGSTRWIQGSGAPLLDRDGELQLMSGVGRDATEEVLDQELLHRRASGAALAADVGRALVRSETIDVRLQSVAEAIVDHFDVAFARIWQSDRAGEVLRLRASAGMYRHLDGEHALVRVGELKIGRIASARRSHVTNELLGDPQLSDPEWARREGMQAFAGFPLMVRDRCVGVLGVFARDALTADVIGSLASITDSVAVAIDQHEEAQRVRELLEETESERARAETLLSERQRVASVLQESLLPPTLPEIDRLDVAGAYRAGIEEVGGDFYDLFPLGGERWGFMIGDVCGRGPEAARYTAVARHSLRTALSLGGNPAMALVAVDEALRTSGTDGRFCTAVCGVVSTADGGASPVRIGIAGHPPPLLLRTDGSVEELASTGPLLGVVPRADFSERSFELEPGDVLVLYTDGMIEARGSDGLFGHDRLRAVATSLAAEPARAITDGLVSAVNEYDSMQTHDDLAVLTLRRR
ncbi:MAG: SpoIIE family protein phosphatase, partial [Ilumatobacter sp.]|nr:SpoIIE family protein phosphatase [Ilumatobacter sp.]